jgi:hypothetical protein
LTTRTSAADYLTSVASAIKMEAEDTEDDEVFMILESLTSRVLDTVEQLDGTDV